MRSMLTDALDGASAARRGGRASERGGGMGDGEGVGVKERWGVGGREGMLRVHVRAQIVQLRAEHLFRK